MAADRLGFATASLDAGARLDVRDNLLKSTRLGWACRWDARSGQRCSSHAVPILWKRMPSPGDAAGVGDEEGHTDLVAVLKWAHS
jgi:hypothetical protein